MRVIAYRRQKSNHRPALDGDDASLHARIAWTIKVFVRVRGIEWLLDPATTLVVRRNAETFFVHDAENVENRHTVAAIVRLKQLDYYDEFKAIQQDPALKMSALGELSINYLADRVTNQVLASDS
ncbi:MAG TPA: hypothetical protein VNO43_06180 [Candidatus Eisenbacteria bacterium]|nr:hypothetical protein [Candidatus Eisenbacteria bacterium]